MKKDMQQSASKQEEELVVIPDECGDTMWDRVLTQPSFWEQPAAKDEKVATAKNNEPSTH